jgi:hypothetical protein
MVCPAWMVVFAGATVSGVGEGAGLGEAAGALEGVEAGAGAFMEPPQPMQKEIRKSAMRTKRRVCRDANGLR